jgi:hypothetical protein
VKAPLGRHLLRQFSKEPHRLNLKAYEQTIKYTHTHTHTQYKRKEATMNKSVEKEQILKDISY